MDGQHKPHPWLADPLMRWLIMLAIGWTLLYVILFVYAGFEPVVMVLFSFTPAFASVTSLASANTAFLAFGRYWASRQPAPLWVGLGFGVFSLFSIIIYLSWSNNVFASNGFLSTLSPAGWWLYQLTFYSLNVCLLAAVLINSQRISPRGRILSTRSSVSVVVAVAAMEVTTVVMQRFFPPILIGSSLTIDPYSWQYVINLGLALAVLMLSIGRYRQSGDLLFGYLGLFELSLTFALLASLMQRYILWYYLQDFFVIIAFSVVLFGLLSEYLSLYRNERRKTRELQSLQQVTDIALTSEGLEHLLHNLIERIVAIMGASGGAALLFNTEKKELEIRATVGLPNATQGLHRIKIGERFAGQVAAKNGAYWVRDAQMEPRIRSEYIKMNQIRAMLGVPMRVGEEFIGVIMVHFLTPRDFTPQDERLLEVVAERAAMAIENARLRRHEEQLAIMEERQRLARDLHDSVTQSLYSAILYAEAGVQLVSSGNVDAAVEHLREVREMAREAMREMRLLIFELRPPVLKNEGLGIALQTRLDAVETRVGLQTKLFIEGNDRLPTAIEAEIYGVAQETLNNVLKHAKAKRVIVRLVRQESEVMLEVRDDGEGFDPTSLATNRGGFGLGSMRERAERVGGTLDIESAIGKGTSVRFVIPIQSPAAATTQASNNRASVAVGKRSVQ